VLELDHLLAEADAQAIMRVPRLDRPSKQTGVVQPRQLVHVSGGVEHLHLAGVGKKYPHHRRVVLEMPAEIVERIMVASAHDGARRCRKIAHACTTPWRARMRQVPSRGTCNQAGRFIISYSIS